jgi:hypothetical protein
VSPTGWYSCFRCGVRGRLDGDEFEPWAHREAAPATAVGAPDGYEPIWGDAWEAGCYAEARAYLAARGVATKAFARELGVGAVLEGQYHHRVVVPVLGGEGEWLGWVGRVWRRAGGDRPYIYPPGEWRARSLYNHAALRQEADEPALVVEGVFDAIACWPDGVAVLGKPSEWQVDALGEALRPVAVVLDGDAHSEGWALAQLLRFRGRRAGAVRLPPGADPDEVPADWLREEARRCVQT